MVVPITDVVESWLSLSHKLETMDKQLAAEWPLTGASFALAELYNDEDDFCEMVTLVDKLQQRKALPLPELVGTELIISFLDEMEHMGAEDEQQQMQMHFITWIRNGLSAICSIARVVITMRP